MKTAEKYINELFKDEVETLDRKKCYLIGKLMTEYAKYYHEQQVKNCDLADVVCSSCGSSNKKWNRYEITLDDKDGTDVDVSVDYCEDCGHVFKMSEY